MTYQILSKFKSFLFLIVLGIGLCSCVETVIIGSISSGSVAIREKSFNSTRKDVVIATKLGSQFITHGLKNIGNSVDITVSEGRVLLTGIVRSEEKAKFAQQLAWKINNVKEVIDEIIISKESLRPKNFSSALIDYLITLQLEAKLFLKSDIHSINYKTTTVDRNVYFLGIANDEAEMQTALDLASKINGVKKVVNHLVLINDVKRK